MNVDMLLEMRGVLSISRSLEAVQAVIELDLELLQHGVGISMKTGKRVVERNREWEVGYEQA